LHEVAKAMTLIQYAGKYVFGHRGLSGILPENTLSAFIASAAVQATGIEFDVRMTADGSLVVIHDNDVSRTTNGHGQIEHLTLEQVRMLSAGVRRGPWFLHERVPTLEEVLMVGAHYGLALDVELKVHGPAPDLARAVIAVTERTLGGDLQQRLQKSNQIWFSSFNAEVLGWIHQWRPTWTVGLLVDDPGSVTQDFVADCDARAQSIAATYLLPPLAVVRDNPDLWLETVSTAIVAYGDDFPASLPDVLMMNSRFAGVIVNDPHHAICWMQQWGQGRPHGS
jgi:glycerophosphoryl diester phosphodiesterase